MYWHIDADVISLIVMLIIYACNMKMPLNRSEMRNKRFRRCLEVGIGVAIIDIAASIIMEIPTSRFLYHALMTSYFVLIELVIVEWFLYALTIIYQDKEKHRKGFSYCVIIPYLFYAVFCSLNPWTGLIYSLGPQNEYSRGPFFSLMIVIFALYTIALFVLILSRWKKIPREFSGGVLLATPVIIALGIATQLSFSGLLLIIPAFMICEVLAFLFLQTKHAQYNKKLVDDLSKVAETDKLTGLLNRAGMEAMVQQTLENAYGKEVIVMIADIDDLKTINDTMGHAQGDRSIRLTAEALKRHFRSGDTVVRYGGDEFLAFFTGDFDEAYVNSSLRRLVNELNTIRIGANDEVALHGSIGAAHGIVGKDSFETLCNRADAALYYVKRNGKNDYALYRPDMTQA